MTQITTYPTTLASRLKDAEARFTEVDGLRSISNVEACIYQSRLKGTPVAEVRQQAREVNIPFTRHTKKVELVEALYQMKRRNYNLPDLEERAEALYDAYMRLVHL